MGTYTFDAGFNWNSVRIGEGFGHPEPLYYPLQLGIVSSAGGKAAWNTQLQGGDDIRFHFTDITSDVGCNPNTVQQTVSGSDKPFRKIRSLVVFKLAVTAVVDGAPGIGKKDSPFQDDYGFWKPIVSGNPGSPYGLVFETGDLSFIEDKTKSKVYNAANGSWKVARWYAATSLDDKGQRFKLKKAAAFYRFSLELEVAWPGEGGNRFFILDPEMFVGGN